MLNVGSRVVNTYVYQAPAGLVMVDTGYEQSMEDVRRRLRPHGIGLSEIRYVFLTYAHDDHAGFLNELLKKHPNIRAIVNPASVPVLRRGRIASTGIAAARSPMRSAGRCLCRGEGVTDSRPSRTRTLAA